MQLLIQQAHILDPSSPFHGQIQDILIENGIIREIGDQIKEKAAETLKEKNLFVSPGWVDVFAHFCDPGFEYKEDLDSGCKAAAAGGFTGVMVIPDTQPALQSKAQIEYIRNKSAANIVEVYPIGALSRNLEGEALAEMYEMRQSGAVAFSDGLNPVQQSGLLLKALQYVKSFDGVIIQVPEDTSISHHGLMNEGIQSTRLGMAGKPAIAEEIMIQRDLELAAYAGSRIHFTGVSTRKGISLIAEAKKNGIGVTCSVTPYHLCLTDELLRDYDANLKVNPPLRTPEDVEALKEAVRMGTVDCIATHHLPQEWDSKQKEFEYAGAGMTGLETCFGILNLALPALDPERRIALLSSNPRKIFHLPPATVKTGETANLTIFNPDADWTFREEDIFSKSKNTPFTGRKMKGKVKAVVNKNQYRIF